MDRLFTKDQIITITYKNHYRREDKIIDYDTKWAKMALLKLGLFKEAGDEDMQNELLDIFSFESQKDFVRIGKYLYIYDDDLAFKLCNIASQEDSPSWDYPDIVCGCGCADFRVLSGEVICSNCKNIVTLDF